MCNFANLQPGESCTLATQEMFCTKCGHTSAGVTAGALYQGHSIDGSKMMDRFALVSLHNCPNCKERFVQYQQVCGNGYSASREAVEQMRAADAKSTRR